MAPELPFIRYEGGGRQLLGRPRLGDLTARHGYGPPVFAQCGLACVYCGLDMSKPYENWLQLSVDHVVPSSTKGRGYPVEWLEDIANLVTCCRACNEFSNAFAIDIPVPSDVETFFSIRDRAFELKRDILAGKHAKERQWYADHVLRSAELVGPDLPVEPAEDPGARPFTYREISTEVDPNRPLIYLWEIRDAQGTLITCYVGRSVAGASRPRRAYPNNIRRLRAGLPWHGQPGKPYRPIHHALSEAIDKGYEVTLTLLCNVEPGEDIDEVERRERSRYGCDGR